MKITASILIIYFSMLMGQPYVNVWLGLRNKPNSCHPAEMCCNNMVKHHHGNASPNQANTCNRDLCNPFVPCGVSITYKMQVPKFENKVLEISKKLKPASNDNIISNYLSDCWRPPKVA